MQLGKAYFNEKEVKKLTFKKFKSLYAYVLRDNKLDAERTYKLLGGKLKKSNS